MAAKRGLNMARGLGSLIPQAQTDVTTEPAETAPEKAEKPAAKAKSSTQKKAASTKKAASGKAAATKSAAANTTKAKAGSTTKASSSKASGAKKTTAAKTAAPKAGNAAKTASPKTSAARKSAKTKAASDAKATSTKAAGAVKAESTKASGTSKTAATKASETAKTAVSKASESAPQTLRISAISPNREQPRSVFEEEALQELADSIKIHGVLQPLLVQKKGTGYELIAGERRWRAARMAGLTEVPVVIREFSEQEAVEISLIENIQREDLNAIEEALAYQRLMDEFRLTQEEVASRVTKSRSAVANSLRLLSLDETVRDMLVAGVLSAGHARALLALEKGSLQAEAAQLIVRDSLSVRETERLINRLRKPRKTAKNKTLSQLDAVYLSLQEEVADRIGSKVTINRIRGKKGTIEIEYYSQEDLERIIGMIR